MGCIEGKLRIRCLRFNASFSRVCSHILGGQDRVSCLVLSCSRGQEFLDLWDVRFLIWIKSIILACKMQWASLSSICECSNITTNVSSIRRIRFLPYRYEDLALLSQRYLFHNSSSTSWRQSWWRISNMKARSYKLCKFWQLLLWMGDFCHLEEGYLCKIGMLRWSGRHWSPRVTDHDWPLRLTQDSRIDCPHLLEECDLATCHPHQDAPPERHVLSCDWVSPDCTMLSRNPKWRLQGL